MSATLTISASEFKARCLALLDQLTEGKLEKVIITKRGKRVGELSPPPPTPPASLHGSLKHMFTANLPSDEDVMAPAFDELWDAERDGPLGGME